LGARRCLQEYSLQHDDRGYARLRVEVQCEPYLLVQFFIPMLRAVGWEEVPLGPQGCSVIYTTSRFKVYDVFEGAWNDVGYRSRQLHYLDVFAFSEVVEQWSGDPWAAGASRDQLEEAVRHAVPLPLSDDALAYAVAHVHNLETSLLRWTLHKLYRYAFWRCVGGECQRERDEGLSYLPRALRGAAFVSFDEDVPSPECTGGRFTVITSYGPHGASVLLDFNIEMYLRKERGF
jgi:hypothetical protein